MSGDRFKIGDTIWCINPSYNYLRDRVKKYEPQEIVSITSRSYIVGKGYAEQKIKKSDAMNEEDAKKQMWVDKYHYRIAESAKRLTTYEELKTLAKMTGWKEPTE